MNFEEMTVIWKKIYDLRSTESRQPVAISVVKRTKVNPSRRNKNKQMWPVTHRTPVLQRHESLANRYGDESWP